MDVRFSPRYDEAVAAQVLGVPRTTVRRWRRQVLSPSPDPRWSYLDLAEGYVLASFRHATGRLPQVVQIRRQWTVPHPLAYREAVDPDWPPAVQKRLKAVHWAADGYMARFPVAHTGDRVVMDARLHGGDPVCARTGAPMATLLPLLQAGLPIDRVMQASGWAREDVEAAARYVVEVIS